MNSSRPHTVYSPYRPSPTSFPFPRMPSQSPTPRSSKTSNYKTPMVEDEGDTADEAVAQTQTQSEVSEHSADPTDPFDLPTMSATLSEPFSMPAFDYTPDEESDDESSVSESPSSRHSSQKCLPTQQDALQDGGVSAPTSPPASTRSSTRNKNRYYKNALSEADKLSLGDGQVRRSWNLKDVVSYQQSRTELVPLGPRRGQQMDKVMRDWSASDAKLRESEQVSRFMGTSLVQKAPTRPRPQPLIKTATYNAQRQAQERLTTKSMHDLRSHPSASTASLQSPRVSPRQTKPIPPYRKRGSADNRGYFSGSHSRNTSTPSSVGTTRIRSPLIYEHKPEVTFDKILAKDKSGKGEVLRDSKDALRDGEPPRKVFSKKPSYDMLAAHMQKRK
jgi:hypothetical protein